LRGEAMSFRTKILEAIKEGNVEDILRGRQKYRVEPPTFVPDVFPTDINQVLFEYFYNQSDIKNIELLLENSLIKLTKSSATDLYISILFFDSILFMEDKGIATFKIDTSKLVAEIASGIQKFREELMKSITFNNGLTKKEPMKVVVRFNQRYKDKYNFSILDKRLVNSLSLSYSVFSLDNDLKKVTSEVIRSFTSLKLLTLFPKSLPLLRSVSIVPASSSNAIKSFVKFDSLFFI